MQATSEIDKHPETNLPVIEFRDRFRDDRCVTAPAATSDAPASPANAIRLGYARVSTRAQDHLSQMQALAGAHCREIVEETVSTRKDRPKLRATVDRMHPGDTLVIYKPDRIARSVKELLIFLEDELAPRGINLEILSGICAGLHRPSGQTIADRMLFMLAGLAAEMERDLISERTLDGLAAAAAHGRKGGRPPAVDDDVLAVARARRARGESVTSIARHLGIGRSTLYRALEDDEPLAAATGQGTTGTARPPAPSPDSTPAPSSVRHAPSEPAALPTAAASSERVSRPAAEPTTVQRPATTQPHDGNAMTAEAEADHGHVIHEDQAAARVPQLRAAPQLGEDYQTARWPHESHRLHLLHHGQPIGYVTGYTGRWRALTPGHDPITLDAVGPDATHHTQAQALAAIALHARHQETRHAEQTGTTVVDDGQALTEAPGESLTEQARTAPTAPASDLYLAQLGGGNCLLLVDGARVGWLHATPDGWQVHGRDGRLVTTLPADDAHGRDVLAAASRAAAALGIPGAEHAAVTVGSLTDDRGRPLDTAPTSVASWSLLKGRVSGRTDVIVRGRCVGWLQRDARGRDVACTLDGPVPGSASTNRVQAVTALLAALLAPAPLPNLDPEARTPRRPRARPSRERPISPFNVEQLAAAALPDNLPRLPDGSYRVHIHDGLDDTDLGRVFRTGRHWQALAPDGRTAVHRADTRTAAVDQLLATPGPLFGDPADTVLHDL